MSSLINKKDTEVEEKTKILQNLINELNNEFARIHEKVILIYITYQLLLIIKNYY